MGYYNMSRVVRGGYLNIIQFGDGGFPFHIPHIRSIYVLGFEMLSRAFSQYLLESAYSACGPITHLYHNLKRFKGVGKLIRYSSPGNVIKMTIHKILGHTVAGPKITQFSFIPTHPFRNLLNLLNLPLSQENHGNQENLMV